MKFTSNRELEKMIKNCKTSEELHRLQSLFANEVIGRITDDQALRILKAEEDLRELEIQKVREIRNV